MQRHPLRRRRVVTLACLIGIAVGLAACTPSTPTNASSRGPGAPGTTIASKPSLHHR